MLFYSLSVGFFQEYRAEKTMDALRQLSSPTAFVTRNGEGIHIPAKNVVPGDIVQIKVGDVVPADVSINSSMASTAIDNDSVTFNNSLESGRV